MASNLDWKDVRSDALTGEDKKIVKALEDARAAFEDYIQKKNGPCLFTYKRGGIAYAKSNGSGRNTVSSL